MEKQLDIVNEGLRFEPVSLVSPTSSHYIHLAAEIDHLIIPAFLSVSRKKKRVIAACKAFCEAVGGIKGIVEAVTFKAKLIPPGRGKFLQQRPGKVHIAKFDVVVLIEAEDSEVIAAIQASDEYQELKVLLEEEASFVHETMAVNARRIGPVDHTKQGIFLFNYFFADNLEQMLGIWEYTAGWFQEVTGLDNSVLLLPANREKSHYTVINHCRWDSLGDILPAILFKKTFHSYVLANFEANKVAAIPVLYVLA